MRSTCPIDLILLDFAALIISDEWSKNYEIVSHLHILWEIVHYFAPSTQLFAYNTIYYNFTTCDPTRSIGPLATGTTPYIIRPDLQEKAKCNVTACFKVSWSFYGNCYKSHWTVVKVVSYKRGRIELENILRLSEKWLTWLFILNSAGDGRETFLSLFEH
jgi:hypothetical protein